MSLSHLFLKFKAVWKWIKKVWVCAGRSFDDGIIGIIASLIPLIFVFLYPLVINFYGRDWGLIIAIQEVENESYIPQLTCGAVVIIIAIIIYWIIIEAVKSKRKKKKKENEQKLQKTVKQLENELELALSLLESNTSIRYSNIGDICRYININKRNKNIIDIASNPRERATDLKEEYGKFTNKYFKKSNVEKYVVELAFRIPLIDNRWQSIDDNRLSPYDPNILANNPRSTYWAVINNPQKPLAFYPSKYKVAKYIEHVKNDVLEIRSSLELYPERYLQNNEESNSMLGSVICKYFSVNPWTSPNGQVQPPHIEAVLGIASQDKPFFSERDIEETKEKFIKDVHSNFEDKLKYELSLLFIKEISNQKKLLQGNWLSQDDFGTIKFLTDEKCEISDYIDLDVKEYRVLNDLTLIFITESNPSKIEYKRANNINNTIHSDEYYLDNNELVIGRKRYIRI